MYKILFFFLPLALGSFVLVAQETSTAEALYQKRQYETAAKELKGQLEKDPKSIRINNNLACTMFQLNQKEEALKYWNLALENSSDQKQSARVNYNIGNYYYKNAQKDKAIESYKKALRLNPDDKLAKYNLEVALKENPPPPKNNSNSPNSNQNNNPPPQQDNKSESKSSKQPQMSKDEAERILNSLQKSERGPNRSKNKEDNSPSSNTGRDW